MSFLAMLKLVPRWMWLCLAVLVVMVGLTRWHNGRVDDAVAIGFGFSGGNAVMLYAGFANAFQSLAQAFGSWEADILAAANKYIAQVQAGDAPMFTPTQAVERIPKFEFIGA